MMNLRMLALGALCFSLSSYAADKVRMPSADVLKKRLSSADLDFLGKKFKIIERFADKEKNPVDAVLELESLMNEYVESLRNKIDINLWVDVSLKMGKSRKQLLEILFKDSPESLRELKQMGLYNLSKY